MPDAPNAHHYVIRFIYHIFVDSDHMVTQSASIHIEDLAPLLVSPDVADRFYKYKGSLTTPGCYESVTWFVMNNHPQITEKEVSDNLTVPRQSMAYAHYAREN